MLNHLNCQKTGRKILKKLFFTQRRKKIDKLIEEIEEEQLHSRFHLRLDKQELVKENTTISLKRYNQD